MSINQPLAFRTDSVVILGNGTKQYAGDKVELEMNYYTNSDQCQLPNMYKLITKI